VVYDRPNRSRSRVKRSIEKPDSLPCFSAEIPGWSIPSMAAD